ncbi:MAG: ribosome hibernation-promoting factor, HPF/YfiA family [Sphingomonadaceae bacterium]
MQVVVKGKNMEVSEKLRRFVENKILKLERVLPEIAEAEVELTNAKTKSADHRYVVQVTLKANGTLIRGEQAADDSYTAMDAVLDKIDRQIARYKTKRFGAYNKGATEAKVATAAVDAPAVEEGRLVRTKRFAMKPMDVEEALMQMELLGHSFYVFNNAESGRVSVVYKRKDGDFGLIEPE